jgi:hypothetical protein
LIQGILLFTEVTLSDDLYRYFLEGKMIINGINPYQVSIQDVPADIVGEFLSKVNNSHITSPYPPLALLFFTFLYILSANTLIFRFAFSLGLLFSIILLRFILPEAERWKMIIFAWNPLLHLEVGNGAHFDVLVILIVSIGILFLQKENDYIPACSLLIAFLFKYYSLIIIILFWKHLGRKGQKIILFGIIGYFILILLDSSIIRGLLIYGNEWYFNASVTWMFAEMFSDLFIAKLIAGGIFLLLFSYLSIKVHWSQEIPYQYTSLALGIFVLLQPTFHPWYLFWIFPFVLFNEKSIPWNWILLSGLLILSYNVYILYDSLNIWFESDFIRLLEYVPFYLITLYIHRGPLKQYFQKIRKRVLRGKN